MTTFKKKVERDKSYNEVLKNDEDTLDMLGKWHKNLYKTDLMYSFPFKRDSLEYEDELLKREDNRSWRDSEARDIVQHYNNIMRINLNK